jgi:hypothetical protein
MQGEPAARLTHRIVGRAATTTFSGALSAQHDHSHASSNDKTLRTLTPPFCGERMNFERAFLRKASARTAA